MDASSWMKLGQIGSSTTSVLPNWYDLDNSENSKDLNEALYGDSTQDPIVRLLMGHNNVMQNVLSQVNSNVTDYSDYKNNTNLENAWDPNALQSNVNADFGWSNIADNLQATATGASYGAQIGGGWGALIGAGVGMLSNIGSQIGYKNRANRINTAVDRANQQTTDSFYNTAKGNQTQMMRDYFMHTPYAEGGLLNEFDTGGSHEENPLGGIPQGIASDGLPNLVEEGEVRSDFDGAKIFNNQKKNYILTEKDCEEYLLPKSVIGCNPAEAIKKLKKEYEDRANDPVSIATMKEWDNRVFAYQEDKTAKLEEKRMKKAIKNMPDEEKAALSSSLEQPMAQQEGIDLSQPMYAKGGKIHIKPSHRGKLTDLKKRTGKTEAELWKTGGPAIRKMITFARNSRKWHKHEDGGHLFPIGGGLGAFDYATDYIINGNPYKTFLDKMSQEQLKVLGVPNNMMSWQPDGKGGNELMAVTNPIEVSEGGIPKTKSIKVQPTTPEDSEGNKLNFNLANLRYAPAVGAGIGALTAIFQPKDYTLANDLRQLSSRYKGVSAPHIGGYRRYTPYDVNLGDAENLALQAQALAANRGQNRATQGALNTAVIAKSQEANAKRNLAAQQANEANRLAVDTYNLGIDQFNAQRDSQYDQLNADINNRKLAMLSAAAQAADASRTAWAANINSTTENAFNQLGNVGRDEWNKNQRDFLLRALGREGLLELIKSGYFNS